MTAEQVKPLAVDLCAGLGGWAHGLLAEGFDVVGIDIEEHVYGEHRYPAGLIIQDLRTVVGSALSKASLFVASPPCTEFSWMAMPWSRAKQVARGLRGEDEFPKGYAGSRTIEELTALFNHCFRIRDEASETKGERIPIVVENVAGAQRWVGQAVANFGSFFLWGDVPLPQPDLFGGGPRQPLRRQGKGRKLANGRSWSDFGKLDYVPFGFNRENEKAIKLPGFRFDGSGRSFQSASVEGTKVYSEDGGRRTDPGKGARFTSRDCGVEGTKNGGDWFGPGENCSLQRRAGSKSSARKFASAMIARIPETLSRHIARSFLP